MSDFEIPRAYADATTNEPLVRAWVAAVAQADSPKLLVLAPGWSGKTHTLWAAATMLLAAGVRREDVIVRHRFGYGAEVPSTSDVLDHRVVMVDPADWFDPHHHFDVDGDPDFVRTIPVPEPPSDPDQDPYDWAEPEDPNEVAYREEREVQGRDLRIQLSRLTYSTTQSALVTATSESTLRRALGEDLTARLLEWPTVQLAKRVNPRPVTW